jgi:GTP:adenosylcobinamide-phosphate guanylyltransferase
MVDSTSQLMRNSMAFVLAGGRGSRLKELTDRRAKPAVYFGGKTRIVDFALSNALNSGIRKMAIATQYKAHSLIRHCQRGWSFFRAERNEYLDILPASQRLSETQWYRGTADAVAQNIDIIDSYDVEYVLILAGDHIYKIQLSVTQTTPNWKGPYLTHPLTDGDNPYGGIIRLYDDFNAGPVTPVGFDLVGRGSDTATGAGQYLLLTEVPESLGLEIDRQIDRGIDGDWRVTGRCEWQNNALLVFLMDAPG